MTDEATGLERDKLNLETAKIPWQSLQVFFARGDLISVSPQLDLVEVAYQFAQDNHDQVQQWLAQGVVSKVSDQQASQWTQHQPELWAVVVKPWVLVQD